jgi:hypothetical protein
MRTISFLKWALTVPLLGAGLALLAACPAQPQRMAVEKLTVPASTRLLGQVAIVDVTGGKAVTMTSSMAEVSNGALHEALRRSLQEAGYLSPNQDGASTLLRVGVVDIEKPHEGTFDMTVVAIIRYVLANKDGDKPLFDELINASCTRTFSFTEVGAVRLQHVEECAVSNNIAAFLTKLSASALTDAATAAPSHAPMSAVNLKFARGPGPYSFDCDARSGYYNELNVAVPGARVQVTGLMQVLTARADRHYAATVNVAIKGAGDLPLVGLRALVMPNAPKTVDLAIRGSGGPQDESVFASTPLTAAPIPFVVTLGDSWRLSVSAGGADASLPVEAFAMTRLNLSCSTAHVRFSNVAVATLK